MLLDSEAEPKGIRDRIYPDNSKCDEEITEHSEILLHKHVHDFFRRRPPRRYLLKNGLEGQGDVHDGPDNENENHSQDDDTLRKVLVQNLAHPWGYKSGTDGREDISSHHQGLGKARSRSSHYRSQAAQALPMESLRAGLQALAGEW